MPDTTIGRPLDLVLRVRDILRRKGWDVAAVTAVVATLVLHVRFVWLDDRPPTDLGHYYSVFQRMAQRWHVAGELDLRGLDSPYSLLLTLLSMPFGPSVGLMELIDGLWLAILLVGAWAVSRSVAGPLAGALTTIVIAGYPQTPVLTRTHWIHHPETAALVGALGLWTWSPSLGSWGVSIATAVLLFFGETIRQTGIPFGVPVGILILAGAWRAGARARLIPVAVALVAGMLWYAPVLMTYINRKAESASEYAKSVGKPWLLFVEGMSTPVFWVVVVLAVLGLTVVRKRDRAGLVAGICVIWIAGAAAAVGLFNVGADNFPIAGVGAGILAGIGVAQLPLASLRGAGFLAGAVTAVFIQTTALLADELVRPVQRIIAPWGAAGPINFFRVYWTPISTDEVIPLVQKACGETLEHKGARCDIIATRGLFNPSWEDGGSFALFLAGMESVQVSTPQVLWDNDGRLVSGGGLVRALVDVSCPGRLAPSQGNRFGAQNVRMQALFTAYGSDGPDAVVSDPFGCSHRWYIVESGLKLDQ